LTKCTEITIYVPGLDTVLETEDSAENQRPWPHGAYTLVRKKIRAKKAYNTKSAAGSE
jgi:hypothetical protein